jgi:hypothetical protein
MQNVKYKVSSGKWQKSEECRVTSDECRVLGIGERYIGISVKSLGAAIRGWVMLEKLNT